MDHDLRLLNRALDPIRSPEDLRQLLERAVLRFDEEEVDEGELKSVPDTSEKLAYSRHPTPPSGARNHLHEQDIILPAGAGKRDAGHKRVVEARDVDPEVVEAHSLCSGLVPETLHRIEALEGSVTGGEDEAEDEDDGNFRLRLGGILGGLNATDNIDVRGVEGHDDGENDDDYAGRNEELGASAPFVRHQSAEYCADKRDHVLKPLEEELCSVRSYTCSGKHLGVVIRHGPVAGPLTEEPNS